MSGLYSGRRAVRHWRSHREFRTGSRPQYAYLDGHRDSVAEPERYLLREEAEAIVHCMIKQNGRRDGFSNPVASSFRDISPETMALYRNGIYELFRRI